MKSHPTASTSNILDTVHEVWRDAGLALILSFYLLMWLGPGSFIRWRYRKAQRSGQTLWLDFLNLPWRKPKNIPPTAPKDSTVIPKKPSKVMKIKSYPAPKYAFAYATPPTSGNVINGWGVTEPRRARKVFHTGDYGSEWGSLEQLFHMISDYAEFRAMLRLLWQARRAEGPVTHLQSEESDPADMAEQIKREARRLGADLVGITEVTDAEIIGADVVPFRYAICIGLPMNREEMLYAPDVRANLAVLAGYREVGEVAIQLAAYIRRLGWAAKAVPRIDTSEILHIPLAVKAGLGQLGKHGSLITRDYGSSLRLATILTELPMTLDGPIDIGVDDFCQLCQVCIQQCPPQAIFAEKQIVRGVEKWYVDFDKCVPYFSANHSCGICIEVCPWSEPGRGSVISQKMLNQRVRP
jgi:NAD-dependent dihydropyrimidine dehydrogenase PreA subunit